MREKGPAAGPILELHAPSTLCLQLALGGSPGGQENSQNQSRPPLPGPGKGARWAAWLGRGLGRRPAWRAGLNRHETVPWMGGGLCPQVHALAWGRQQHTGWRRMGQGALGSGILSVGLVRTGSLEEERLRRP